MQEAEIGRIEIPGQLTKNVCETASQQKKKKLKVVVQACHPSFSGKCKIGGSKSRLTWAKKRDPIFKITRAKRTGGVTQAVELQPSKHKALSSNPSTPKKTPIP
jgi:ribosomal protein L31